MRVVVSGTHASGKSTLVSDAAAARDWSMVLEDPYELLEESTAGSDAGSFVAQLELAADRLLPAPPGAWVIAERGPLDFLAYLDALAVLDRPTCSVRTRERLEVLAAAAMQHVDLLVVLPLDAGAGIVVPDDEDPALRSAMDDRLLELVEDPALTGPARVVELGGAPTRRLARLMEVLH
ncbi:MAG: hypothetical protein EON52_24330, partial [Actinomycetales bacterium]